MVCLALIPASGAAQGNLVANGDFESGNTDFSSTYTFIPPPGVIGAAGTYGIDDNPRDRHPNWVTMGDHTTGMGDMMIINGSPNTGPDFHVWQSPDAGDIAIAPNTDYFFEAFVVNVHPANGAILTFEVFNGATSSWDSLGTVSLVGVPAAEWRGFSFIWNSGSNTSTQLRLLNAQPAGGGNDFAIDDIHFGAGSSIAGIDLEKTGDGPDPLTVGDTVDYSFVVTNTGTESLSDVTVTDPLPGLSTIDCPDDTLAPGDDMTCVASYTVTQDDVDAGVIENTATASGQSSEGIPVSAEDSETIPLQQTAGVAIEKSGSGPDPLTVGATVEYSFVVTNTGNVTLSNITVNDPLPGISPIQCPGDTLAPGAEMTCTATYTVTQDDADAGFVENTATVTGNPPSGPPVSAEDGTVVPPSQKPGISLEKSGSGPDPLTVGASIDYTFLVTNIGNVTLSNVTVTDPLPGLSPISCPGSTLAPGAEMTCTAGYTVTQQDVDAGVIENTATVTGQPPQGPPVTDEDSAMFPPARTPGISMEKSGSGPDPLVVGATVEYSFVVTNTGNVTLTNVTVTDPLPGLSPIDCPSSTLAPGAEMTCTATYTVTQDDADAGFVGNTATVTGNPPSGPPVSDEDGAVVPPSQKPGISVQKSASGPDPLTVGATIDYTFLVANIGNVTLSNITVTDPLPGLSPISCPNSTLAPGAEMTCTATYTVTQQDADAGTIENTATVTGRPPGALPPVEDEDSTVFPPDQDVGISIEKSGSGPDPLTVGATVDYTFLVTNTGNVTLSNITITDRLPGLSPISCPGTTLAPRAEMTCTAAYTVTQANVDAGVIVNTATVTGHPPTGGPPATAEDTATVPPVPPVPALPPLAMLLLVALLSALAMVLLRRVRA